MVGVADLSPQAVRGALAAWGLEGGQRQLREALQAPGAVAQLLSDAPSGAREAFTRLTAGGPLEVSELLGRAWWGRGALPAPLDWLQRRALVAVQGDRVVAVREAVHTHEGPGSGGEAGRPPIPLAVQVQAVRCVVTGHPAVVQRALAVSDAELRAVADGVAVSDLGSERVARALRAAGVATESDLAVAATPQAPALPGAVEEASRPAAVRSLLDRALEEGRQVRLHYFASSRGGTATDRVVDPWAFENDLLRGWCHLRRGERTFAVDRIGHLRLLPSGVEHHPA